MRTKNKAANSSYPPLTSSPQSPHQRTPQSSSTLSNHFLFSILNPQSSANFILSEPSKQNPDCSSQRSSPAAPDCFSHGGHPSTTKPSNVYQARSWSLEGSLKLKNLFGYADLWDGSTSCGWDQTSELSAGVALPQVRQWSSLVFARASLLSQDWQTFSSYKERALGIGFGLLSTKNHSLMYSLTWRSLTDPLQMSGTSVRRQLGHSLISSLKYTFKVDKRHSPLRPTREYAFSFSTLLAGLNPDNRSARFVRQWFGSKVAYTGEEINEFRDLWAAYFMENHL